MKVTCLQENLAKGLGIVARAVAARTTLPITQHVLLSTDSDAQCPPNMPSGRVVMSVLIPPGAPPAPRVEWCAPLSGETTAPVVTTTDGTNEAVVWYTNNGALTGVDGATGAVLYKSTDSCSGIVRWTSPIVGRGRIVAGGAGHLCAWTVH